MQGAAWPAGAGQGGVGAAEQAGGFERGRVAHETPGNVGVAVDEGAAGLQLGAALVAEDKAAHIQALRYARRIGGAPGCPAGFGEGFVEAVGFVECVALDDACRRQRTRIGIFATRHRGAPSHFHHI